MLPESSRRRAHPGRSRRRPRCEWDWSEIDKCEACEKFDRGGAHAYVERTTCLRCGAATTEKKSPSITPAQGNRSCRRIVHTETRATRAVPDCRGGPTARAATRTCMKNLRVCRAQTRRNRQHGGLLLGTCAQIRVSTGHISLSLLRHCHPWSSSTRERCRRRS